MAQQKMVKEEELQQRMIKDDQSLGDLFSSLAAETGTLIRQEVSLAQVELTQKAVIVGKNVGFLVVGGAVGYAALLVLLSAVVIILSNFIPLWASALLVGAVVGIISFFLVSSALAELKKTDLAPHETVESIKEDAQWLKDQVS
ncbi:MAG: phage holin family protein [Pyrinomonadaceae bacterium]|nr:phage holin family protein [Acidobacteriota bacterium]MDQ3489524.1 phage holin family protein [Acidobacteriota bacterium]